MWVWIAAIVLLMGIVLLRRNREGITSSNVTVFQDFETVILTRPIDHATYGPPNSPPNDVTAAVKDLVKKGITVIKGGIHTAIGDPFKGKLKEFKVFWKPDPAQVAAAKVAAAAKAADDKAAAAKAAADKAAADKAAADKAAADKAAAAVAAAVAAKYTMKPNQQLTKAMMLGMGGATSDVTQALTECDSNSRCMGIGYQTYGPYKQSYMYSDISNPETTPSNLINTYINQPRVDQAAADKVAAAAAAAAASTPSDKFKDWTYEKDTVYGNYSATNPPVLYQASNVDSCMSQCANDTSQDCLGIGYAQSQTPFCVKFTSLTNKKTQPNINMYINPKQAKDAADKAAADKAAADKAAADKAAADKAAADKAAADKDAADKAAADKAAADKAAAELTASSTVSSKYSDWTMQADTYYYMDTYLKGDAATLDECIASCDTSTDPCLGIGYTPSGSQGNCLRYMTLKSNPRTYVGLNFYKNPKSAIPLNTSIDSPPMPSDSMDPNSNPMMYYPNLTAAN